jgi:glycopeptide antibiotics resistance protein
MAPTQALRTAVAEVGMIAGTAPWLWMILTPLPEPRQLHLVPLVDLWHQFQHPLAMFFQVVGNLLVFSAFGFLAPVRWPVGPLWVVAVAASSSAVVETLQWVLNLGRVTSVDDVIVNAVGAGLACLASRRWWAAHETQSIQLSH